MCAVLGVFAAYARNLARQGDYGFHAAARAPSDAASQFTRRPACKFESADLQTDCAIALLHPIDSPEIGEDGGLAVGSDRAAARRQGRLNVACVGKIDSAGA